MAVSVDGQRWVLLNVSPDIAAQIEAHPPLQPSGVRGTPIVGMLLTDANVDHLGGFATLRQAGNHAFTVRSSRVVYDIATAQPAFATFARPPHRWLCADEGALEPGADDDPIGRSLQVRAIPVPGLTPGFAGREAVMGAVTAYALSSPEGRTLLFAPVFSHVDERLAREIRAADVSFIDGSFFSDDEMLATGVGDKRASDLGHAPLSGPRGTLTALGTVNRRVLLTHVNNTNPVLDPASAAALQLGEHGIEVAADALVIEV